MVKTVSWLGQACLPGIGVAVLIHHRQDGDLLSIGVIQDRIGEAADQLSPHAITYSRADERTCRNA